MTKASSNGIWSTLLFIAMLLLSFTVTYLLLRTRVSAPITTLNQSTQEVVDGLSQGSADLSKEISINQSGEIGLLARSFSNLTKIIANIMDELLGSSEKLSSATERTTAIAEQTRVSTQQRLTNISSVVNAVAQLHNASQSVVQKAVDTAEESTAMNQAASKSQHAVEKTVAAITELEENIIDASTSITRLDERSDNIGNIVSTIDGIAEQTNLLALNAAIEAARAGEQGRGFAVVADEVRTLAKRTQEATSEISQLVTDLQQDSRQARHVMSESTDKAAKTVTAVQQTDDLLTTISEKIAIISEMNLHIASAAEEQTTTLSQINTHMNSVETEIKETLAGADDIVNECANLNNLSEHLTSLLNRSRA